MSKSFVIALIVGLVVGFGVGFWSGKSAVVKKEGAEGAAVSDSSVAPTNSFSGTIKKKSGDGFVIEIDSNYPPREREVVVWDNTQITRDGQPATLGDLRVGDYIFLNSNENIAEKQKFEAVSVFVKVPAQ